MYIAGVTFEYMRLMETAPQVAVHLPASELKGDYRVLVEFNSVVLAGQPTQYGCQFVTWSLSNGGSLCQGHYFGPTAGPDFYVSAKRDFAVRSGLISKSNIFSSEQQTEIYRNVRAALENGVPATCEQEKCLESVLEQIEDNFPNVEQSIGKEQQ